MASIYRSKITDEYKTQNLVNFLDKVGDEPDKNSIYLMFGRSDSWADNELDLNFAPPYPDDSPDGQADAWHHALGFVKIPKEQLKAVLPRRDWGDFSLGADAYRYNIGDVVVTNTINANSHPSALSGYMVYRCIDVPDVGACTLDDVNQTFQKTDCIALGGKWNAVNTPGTINNIPNGTGDGIDTQDGYFWEYLYTIPPSEVINSVTSEYIIVPFPDDVNADPSEWGLTNEITYETTANRIIYSIGAHQLRFRAKLSGGDFAKLATPGNSGYRQLNILLNILLYRKDSTFPQVKATDATYLPEQLEESSGTIIYMENRQPIFKAPDQVEEISLIFQF